MTPTPQYMPGDKHNATIDMAGEIDDKSLVNVDKDRASSDPEMVSATEFDMTEAEASDQLGPLVPYDQTRNEPSVMDSQTSRLTTMLDSHTSSHGTSTSRRQSVYVPIGTALAPDAKVRLFSPPRQRQKWGCDQVLPHVNWGDLFFDLFYVAGFYNLGILLKDDPTALGLLYFCGCFFPLMGLWKDKMYYDCWFVYHYDVYHKIYETAVLVVLATCVGSIHPVSRLSNPSEHWDVFGFSLGLALAHLLNMLRYFECYCFGRGQKRNIQAQSLRVIKKQIVPFVFCVVAAVLSGVEYFCCGRRRLDGGGGGYDNGSRGLAEDAGDKSYSSSSSSCGDGKATHLPIIFLLFGWLLDSLIHYVDVVFLFPKNGEHKKITIPLNVDFAIHRMGEWTMLMLGESVLSLLITDGGGRDYLAIFYAGIITVVLLQLLHFLSQPHDPNAHAMRRSKNAGITAAFVFQIYSAALVAVGITYKMLLYGIGKYDDGYKKDGYDEDGYDGDQRWLAPASDGYDDDCGPTKAEKAAMIAHLFSGAMATVFLCLDLSVLLHVGLEKGLEKVRRVIVATTAKNGNDDVAATTTTTTKTGTINLGGIVFVLIPRVAITVFVATLSQWETHPRTLAELGCAAVVGQLVTRLLGDVFFPAKAKPNHEHDRHRGEGIEDDDSKFLEE